MKRSWTRPVVGGLMLCLVFATGTVFAKNPVAKQAEEELEFGYKAAKRGYWQEALERFEIADELTPNQPKILNNIGVALEANGRFDEARLTYQAGLALDPSNSALRGNFERFQEFYKTFVLTGETEEDEGDDEETSTADDGDEEQNDED